MEPCAAPVVGQALRLRNGLRRGLPRRAPWRDRFDGPAPEPGYRDLLSHSELAKSLALANALAIIDDGLLLVVEIEFYHVNGLFRSFHRLRSDARHRAEIVDLPRDDERMLELLMRVLLELRGNVHVFGALQRLRIDNIGDDRLIFARKVLVQELRQLFPGDVLIGIVS